MPPARCSLYEAPVPDFSYHDIHRLSAEDVLKRLETTNAGLFSEDAQRRLAQYGLNVLVEPDHYSLLRGLLHHFTHFLAVLLWIAAGLSFLADRMKPGEGMATLGVWLVTDRRNS